MNHTSPIVIAMALSSLFAGQAQSADVDLGIGQRDGEVIYQIGGLISASDGSYGMLRFPISELRFPLNSPVVNVRLTQAHSDGWHFAIAITETLANNTDPMRDSDWGIQYYIYNVPGSNPDSLDAYSESQLSIDGTDLSLELFRKVSASHNPWQTEIGAGLLHQSYAFVARNTVQQYPSTPSIPADFFAGETITYDYTSEMVYAAIKTTRTLSDKLRLELFAAYSPAVKVTDKDNHLLRDKIATGRSEGWGRILMGKLTREIGKDKQLFLLASHQTTATTGKQHQSGYELGSYYELNIGMRHYNRQQSIKVGISASF